MVHNEFCLKFFDPLIQKLGIEMFGMLSFSPLRFPHISAENCISGFDTRLFNEAEKSTLNPARFFAK